MNEFQKEAIETVRNLSLQIMLIAAAVFGIVGGFISSSSKTFSSKWLIVISLLCFALSTMAGYILHGSMVSLLSRGEFDPYNIWIQLSGLIQILLFVGGGVFFIIFVCKNL